MENETVWWTSKQVMTYARIAKSSLRRYVIDGRLPKPVKRSPVKQGRRLFDRAAVVRAVAKWSENV